MILNESVSVSLVGNSTTGLSVQLAPAYTLNSAVAQDYLHDTYVVNPSTSNTNIVMGMMNLAHHVFLVCDGMLTVRLTQGGSPINIVVGNASSGGALLLDGDFTAIGLANASATTAVNVTLLLTGDRPAVGSGSGVFLSR